MISLIDIAAQPRVKIHLQHQLVANADAFYARITAEFYDQAMARHRRFPFMRQFTFGVALCPMRHGDESYSDRIESSGRRNVKKAVRLGYVFGKINYNDYLGDIGAIRGSTDVRQGRLDRAFLEGEVEPCRNPTPCTPTHHYPYFGVLRPDGRLVAYAGVLIAGELAMIEHIYGHADHHSDGIVPLLLVEMANGICRQYPAVRYYGYGSYFGASESMRRFKRKFCFMPHRVLWELES